MEATENQPKSTPKELLRARMSSRYPDRHFRDENGENGEDDIEQAILDTLDEYDKYNDEMLSLFSTDARSADFITNWVKTGDPRAALLETFGDDFIEAAKSEDGLAQFKGQLDSWRARKKADDDARAQYEQNWDKSLEDLDKWGDENGLTQEQKVAVIMKLVDVSSNAIQNIYTPADFDMANKALHYTSDVEAAREAGVVEGRNAKIDARRKTKDSVGSLPPAIGGGQGIRAQEKKPQRPQSPWDGIQ